MDENYSTINSLKHSELNPLTELQSNSENINMKNVLFLIAILSILSCKKVSDPTPDNTIAQNTSVLIQPNQTDAGYATSQESHYVVRNSKTHLNKLLLFIGGSYSVPKNYNLVCDHAATIGLDVISLSYPNDVAAAPLGVSSDKLIFDNYRDEVCLGNQVSNEVSVNVLNSINTRATKLVIFLKNTYPEQNWGQYLTSSNTLQWDKIIVSGHSQGSGHACYLGKKNLVDRVVMFSGPNDYSIFYGKAGNWLTQSGQTPLTKQFALLHTQDEIVPFTNQVANLRGLGLLTATQNPTLADDLVSPYNNQRSLSLNIPANSYHSSTIGGNAKLPNIWTYLFTGQ
jgi:hypothetical protein